MKQLTFILFTLSLFCVSCFQPKPKHEHSGTLLDLNNSSNESVTCSDIIDVCDWIMLDSSSNCLLKSIERLDFYNGNYYVLDRFSYCKIFVFDSRGKLLKTIGTKGGGPGEYSEIQDFTIDKTNGILYILAKPSEVYAYDYNGNFIKSKHLDESFLWKITATNGGILLSSIHKTYTEGENAYLFYEFDKDLNLKQKQISVLPKQMNSMCFLTIPFQLSGDRIYYCDEFCNKIYSYSEGKITEEFDIDLSDAIDYNLRSDFMTANQHLAESDFIMNFAVSGNKMLLIYVKKGPLYAAIIDKSDGHIISNKSMNDVFSSVICSLGNGEFLTPVSIEEYQNAWKNTKVKQPDFQVADDDNFLILKWKLR